MPKFYPLIEFPYPSGHGLHVGHPRSNTALDIIARKRRMEGYNVLYPIGWDAFGLPTENYAIKTGIHPAKVSHDNIEHFRAQLKLSLIHIWVVKYLIEYERITGEEFEKIFRNEPVELVSYKERKEALEKPDEEEKPEDESDDRTGDEPEQRHEGSGEDSSEDKPEKEAEQKFYRPGGFDGEDK